MNENILVHYGIKGMKWGIRRYQNTDGSLTAAGRQHYNVGKAKNTSSQYPSEDEMQRTVKRKSLEKAYDKAIDRKDPEQIANMADAAINKTRNTFNKVRNDYTDNRKKQFAPTNLENMTTRELQEAVNRMNLEENYKRLIQNKEYSKRGRDYVEIALDSLDEIANLAGIAASVAAVIAVIKKVPH